MQGDTPWEMAARLLAATGQEERPYPHFDIKVSALGARLTTAITPHSGFYHDLDPVTFEAMIAEFRKAQAKAEPLPDLAAREQRNLP